MLEAGRSEATWRRSVAVLGMTLRFGSGEQDSREGLQAGCLVIRQVWPAIVQGVTAKVEG